jgi:xanthine dehydrogenase YagS FAD-binding subunit
MKSFEHVNATTASGAVKSLGLDSGSKLIAGGTDLLTQMKAGIIEPRRLVNLKTIPGLDTINFDDANGLELGPLATLDSIGAAGVVRERYTALYLAIEAAASPQLRNFGTIGGNLVQGSRCWYYRGAFKCWLKGGVKCYARDGENSHHVIFDGGPCHAVQPSDPAIALVGLGAEVTIAGRRSKRTVPLGQLFQKPSGDSRQLTVLKPDEIIVSIRVPPPVSGSRSTYLKAMERKAWAFALASVAASVDFEGDTVKYARIVLGGVASTPWRTTAAELFLKGKKLDDNVIQEAAALAVQGAQPLRKNGYKIALVKGIVAQALSSLAQGDT